MSSISQLYDENGELKFDLITASSLGDLSLVELILRNSIADVNEPNSSGWTPLMYASHYGHYNVIRMLIQYNVNVNYQDSSQGRSALMLAACNGHTRSIETLLNYGKADKNLGDFFGHDALHYAKTCGHGNNKMIKSLLGKEGYELRGRSYSAPVIVPQITVTNPLPISKTPKKSLQFDSTQYKAQTNEQTVIYNPCEPSVFSNASSSFWRPIKPLKSIENSVTPTGAQVIPTAMPPTVLTILSKKVQALEEKIKYLEHKEN